MYIPWWKKALSYITEIHLESTTSEHTEDLHVYIVNGQLQLCSNTVIYSYGVKYDNFTETFNRIQWNQYQPKTCLVLGLGLGSIPQLLEQNHKLDIAYTAVEIDEEVIYLMSKYALPQLSSSIEIIQSNALNFIDMQYGGQKYDMICIDLFIDDIVPDEFRTPEFLEDVHDLLSEDGVLFFNHLGLTRADQKLAKAYFEEIFQKVLPDGQLLQVKGNCMLISRKDILK